MLLHRKEFYANSSEVMRLVAAKEIKGYVSASAITDIYYIIRKGFGDRKKALGEIERLLRILKVAKVDAKVIFNAVKLGWTDFEDAAQYSAAQRSGCRCVITRNTGDFSGAKIPVLSPKDFLAKIK